MNGITAPDLLSHWQNFYVMVGAAAASLTGLQFVVVALVTEIRQSNTADGIDAFSTPTIVYFGTVLLLSALMCAPWTGTVAVALLITLCGAAGAVYAAIVARRALRQTAYQMVLEDWLFHMALPLTAHAMLFVSGLALMWHFAGSLFAIAAAALLLLFIGIHNAWDTVTYLVIQQAELRRADRERREHPQKELP